MFEELNEFHERLAFFARLTLALGIFLLALVIRFWILPLDAGMANIIFCPAMVLSFFLCGIGPGALVSILSASSAYYVFVAPHWRWELTQSGSVSAGILLVCALLIGYIIEQMHAYAKKAHSFLELTEKKEALFRGILEDQTEYILRFLPDDTLTYVNDAFCRFFGKDGEEFIGKKWTSILFPDDLPFFHHELNKLSPTHPIIDVENRVIGSNGNMHWCRFVNRGFFDGDGHLTQIQSVGRDITTRKNLEEELRRMAFTDGLTRLANRRLLQDRLRHALVTMKRTGKSGALMFIDLDNFKPINDRYGHEAGDVLLIEVAQRIKSSVREMDTVARIGGDEFVAMVGEFDGDLSKSVSHVNALAQKVSLALAEPYLITIDGGDTPHYIAEHLCTASIGVVLFPQGTGSAEEYLKWADKAMYQAKAAGRNAVRFYQIPSN